jgi:hypothetical protein
MIRIRAPPTSTGSDVTLFVSSYKDLHREKENNYALYNQIFSRFYEKVQLISS